MANPLFNALGGNEHQNGNMLSQFQQFMGQMKGKNPNEILNNLVSSGQVSQSEFWSCAEFCALFSVRLPNPVSILVF